MIIRPNRIGKSTAELALLPLWEDRARTPESCSLILNPEHPYEKLKTIVNQSVVISMFYFNLPLTCGLIFGLIFTNRLSSLSSFMALNSILRANA